MTSSRYSNSAATADTFKRRLWRKIESAVPSLSHNLASARVLERLRDLALNLSGSPIVLVVGSGDVGEGLAALIEDKRFRFIELDVYIGSRNHIIADVHDLPFKSGCVDVVIC
jgi:hypothetical protein